MSAWGQNKYLELEPESIELELESTTRGAKKSGFKAARFNGLGSGFCVPIPAEVERA